MTPLSCPTMCGSICGPAPSIWSGGFPPPAATAAQQAANPNNYTWGMRAIFVGMDNWVRKGIAPPASQYSKLSDGTLVNHADLKFPKIPGAVTLHHSGRLSRRSGRAFDRAQATIPGAGGGRRRQRARAASASRKSRCRWPLIPAGISALPRPARRPRSFRCKALSCLSR